MSYHSPASRKDLEKSLNKFQSFFYISTICILVMIGSIFILCKFWYGNILWGIGSAITIIAIIESKYFDIKKNGNPQNRRIVLENIFQPEQDRKIFKRWLALEEIIQYSWILGAILLIISRWILF